MVINFVEDKDIQKQIQECIPRDPIIADIVKHLKEGKRNMKGFGLSGKIL